MNFKLLSIGLLVSSALLTVCTSDQQKTESSAPLADNKKPNIVIFYVDDLG